MINIKQLNLDHLKEQDDGKMLCYHRPDLVPVTDAITGFMNRLHHAYANKPTKGYCAFSADKSSAFSTALANYLNKSTDFLRFSYTAADLMGEELSRYGFVQSGYLLSCHYTYLSTEYLLITLLNVTDHFQVDQALDIGHANHLDLSTMQLAAQINLTDMAAGHHPERCITFVKGRAGRKVADFFLDFMGCEETVSAKAQSNEVVKAVEQFCVNETLDADETTSVRKSAHSYLLERAQLDQPARLSELSGVIGLDAEDAFTAFCAEQEYALASTFPVDKGTVKKLVKYSGQGGGVSLAFDKKLFGTRIQYDTTTDTLTLIGVPPNLKDQLITAMGNTGVNYE
jgi:nucleoid-associated protein